MDKGKKIAISILFDLLLLAAIVYCVYLMTTKELSHTCSNICKAIIVVCIPVMFLTTFISTSWDRYDEEKMGEDDDDDNDENKEEIDNIEDVNDENEKTES